jgi:hypothetical protein
MCTHQPKCPSADSPARQLAHTVAFHPEQGWSLLCNGVVVFDDLGELLPTPAAAPTAPIDLTSAAVPAARAA